MRILVLVLLLCLSFYVSTPSSLAEAPKSKKAQSFLSVPVFFVTDRKLEGNSFTGERKYAADCKHDPYMGKLNFVIASPEKVELSSEQKELGLAIADKTKEPISNLQILNNGLEYTEAKEKFLDAVATECTKPGQNGELVVFVHGYNTPFAGAIRHGAEFSRCFGRPAIVYSWPSVSKLRTYTSDEANNEWSQEHFNQFLDDLGELHKRNPAIKVILVAHSLGSRLIVRAAPILKENEMLKDVALVCPDIDYETVRHYLQRYATGKGKFNVWLYTSTRDNALAFSQIMHGGYFRLGECGNSIVELFPGLKPAEASTHVSDADKQRVETVKAGLAKRMHTIDFTELDSGLLGHKIPHELIEQMCQTGAPGPGLSMVETDAGETSKLGKMLFKSHGKESFPAERGRCNKVVRNEQKTQ
ncbi:MAG: alpha/beta hydrolase [Candidatus Obscuribacterales bacterium]|nr:alpha/beta hydrolase [Candidatus Obscuribacterales bacterium]